MKLTAARAFLRSHRRFFEACFMLFMAGWGVYLAYRVSHSGTGWLVVVALVAMWISGYGIRPHIEPYVKVSFCFLNKWFAPLRKWFGPPLRGWLSNPRSNLEGRRHSHFERESKPKQ